MNEKLIAPCGMNCSLCVSYQFMQKDLNQLGFYKRYCPGCIPRGDNCTYMRNHCELIGEGKIRFCTECEVFPCKRLIALDERYRTKYHMSMLENLECIEKYGIEEFVKNEKAKWSCKECGNLICCHNGLCLNCNIKTLKQNKKYHWNDN